MSGRDPHSIADQSALVPLDLPAETTDLARRMILRLANRHGCAQDGPCRKPGHARDVAGALECWRALGLVGDPETDRPRYCGYGPRPEPGRRSLWQARKGAATRRAEG